MGITFEWDDEKAKANLKKHRVPFEEASSVFANALSLTIADPLHSDEEDRFVTLGESHRGRFWWLSRRIAETRFGSSVPGSPHGVKGKTMKKAVKPSSDPEMLAEYDFRGGVRGKYAARFAAGTNVVVLAPDVAEAFPDSDAVNEALRALITIARKSHLKITA